MAAPEIKKLVSFPPVLTLFPGNSMFQSDTTTSGARVLSGVTGNVVMRFEVGTDWTFENGTQQQQMTGPVVAGQSRDLTMPYRLKTALPDALIVKILVVVTMEGETSEESSVNNQAVGYATMVEKFFHMFKFGKGAA